MTGRMREGELDISISPPEKVERKSRELKFLTGRDGGIPSGSGALNVFVHHGLPQRTLSAMIPACSCELLSY